MHHSKIYSSMKIILEDVNIPYNFTIDRNKNRLFFCINADELCDQSFQSAVVDLNTGTPWIIPSIRNGFASAVDNNTSTVYLAGSDGIYKYNYQLNDIEKPALIENIDVFDMEFHEVLYFIDTANLNLNVLKNGKKVCYVVIEEYGIQHFTCSGDLVILSNSNGLYYVDKKYRKYIPVWFSNSVNNIRGLVTNVKGVPHIVAQNGIYSIDLRTMDVVQLMSLQDGYALDFDKNDDMFYSDGRSVLKLRKPE